MQSRYCAVPDVRTRAFTLARAVGGWGRRRWGSRLTEQLQVRVGLPRRCAWCLRFFVTVTGYPVVAPTTTSSFQRRHTRSARTAPMSSGGRDSASRRRHSLQDTFRRRTCREKVVGARLRWGVRNGRAEGACFGDRARFGVLCRARFLPPCSARATPTERAALESAAHLRSRG